MPLSEAKGRLSELTRRVRQQHERITIARNGHAEAVLLSVDDLDGLEMTLEILGDSESVARITGMGEHEQRLQSSPAVRRPDIFASRCPATPLCIKADGPRG